MTHRPLNAIATAAILSACAPHALAQHAGDPATRRSLSAADLGALVSPSAVEAGVLPDPAQCVGAMDCAQPGDFAAFINASFFDSAEVMEFAETGALTRICTTFVFAGGSCAAAPSDPSFNQFWTWDFFPVNSEGIPSSASVGHFSSDFPTANMTVENFFTGTIGAGFPVFNYTFTLGDGGQAVQAGTCFAMQPKYTLVGCSAFWETSSNTDGSLTGDGLSLQDALGDGYDSCDYTANDLLLCLDVLTVQPPACTVDAVIDAPPNDNCDGASAFPLVCDATTVQCLLFATQNTQDDPALPCALGEPDGFTGDVTAFYTFTPTSSRAILSMCRVFDGNGPGGNAPFPNGDFVLAVYEEAQTPGEGEGPCDLVQIACSDDNCRGNKPILCLNDLDPMTTYVVQVAGHDAFDGVQIELDVTCDPMDIPPVPLNDNCIDAEELVFDGPPTPGQRRFAVATPGSTVCATMDPVAGGCGTTSNGNSPGVWFTAVGDGTTWALFTNFAGPIDDSDYDTQINVYCGDCSTGLICLTGNDDCSTAAPQSCVTFCTEAGRRYYIFLHGFFDVGNYGLRVETNTDFADVCQNDPPHAQTCSLIKFVCEAFHAGPPDIDESTSPAALMEMCGEDINNGCVTDPNSGTAFIEAGSVPFTACGNIFAANGERDLDDFRFSVNDRSLVTIDILAEFDPEYFLFDSDDCASQVVVLNETGAAGTTLSASAVLNPGVYVLRVTADQFNGVPCGITNSYALRVDAEPLGRCCILNEFTETECCVTTEAVCNTLGTSTLFFAGGDCAPVTYARSQTLTIAPFESITEETHAMTIDGGDGDGLLADDDAQTVIIAGPDSQLTDFLGNPGEFPFEFFNECVRSITVHTDGYISFDRGLAPVNDNTPEPIPTPGPEGTLNSFIAPLWTDLDPSATGEVALLLDGAAPFRRLIIEWHNVPNFDQIGTSNTFQLVLFEGSDCARFLYNDIELPVITDPMDPEYAVGVENQDGTQGASLTEAEIEALDTSMLSSKEARIIEFCPEHELEFPCDEIPVCRGDCDDDGTVNFNDLVAMLFEFGNPNPSFGCDADDDNDVDFNDLVSALFLFGPCP